MVHGQILVTESPQPTANKNPRGAVERLRSEEVAQHDADQGNDWTNAATSKSTQKQLSDEKMELITQMEHTSVLSQLTSTRRWVCWLSFPPFMIFFHDWTKIKLPLLASQQPLEFIYFQYLNFCPWPLMSKKRKKRECHSCFFCFFCVCWCCCCCCWAQPGFIGMNGWRQLSGCQRIWPYKKLSWTPRFLWCNVLNFKPISANIPSFDSGSYHVVWEKNSTNIWEKCMVHHGTSTMM